MEVRLAFHGDGAVYYLEDELVLRKVDVTITHSECS